MDNPPAPLFLTVLKPSLSYGSEAGRYDTTVCGTFSVLVAMQTGELDSIILQTAQIFHR